MTDYDNNRSPIMRTPTNHTPGVSALYNAHIQEYKRQIKRLSLKRCLWGFVKTGNWEDAKNLYRLMNEMGAKITGEITWK